MKCDVGSKAGNNCELDRTIKKNTQSPETETWMLETSKPKLVAEQKQECSNKSKKREDPPKRSEAKVLRGRWGYVFLRRRVAHSDADQICEVENKQNPQHPRRDGVEDTHKANRSIATTTPSSIFEVYPEVPNTERDF